MIQKSNGTAAATDNPEQAAIAAAEAPEGMSTPMKASVATEAGADGEKET